VWYGHWYGDSEDHDHTGLRTDPGDSRFGGRRTGGQRLGFREARRKGRASRRSRMEGDAGGRAAANGWSIDGPGKGLGRFASVGAKTEDRSEETEDGLSGITFDAGGLIELDRNDRRVLALIARAMQLGVRITIPATALAQAILNPARQARLSRFIRQPGADLVALDGPDATAVGLLLAQTGTADIIDAHVVVCARRAGQAVVTSDAADLGRIAPDLRLESV
jgi:hypothetical protein